MNQGQDKPYYLEGISVPETPEPGKEPAPWKNTQVLGKPRPRVDAYQRVSGVAVYPSDVVLPDMLYGAVLGCPHPNAMVKRVDISAALRMPGVHAVVSGSSRGADLKWTYRGKAKSKVFDPHCRYEGDAVAGVAADSPYNAQAALKALKVEYEVLPFVSDERQALDQNSTTIHEKGNLVEKPEVYRRGDVEKGFGEADVVLETEYRSECEIHTPMELHGCVAKWDGDSLTIWSRTRAYTRCSPRWPRFWVSLLPRSG